MGGDRQTSKSHHVGKADCNNKSTIFNNVYSTDSDNFTSECCYINLKCRACWLEDECSLKLSSEAFVRSLLRVVFGHYATSCTGKSTF